MLTAPFYSMQNTYKWTCHQISLILRHMLGDFCACDGDKTNNRSRRNVAIELVHALQFIILTDIETYYIYRYILHLDSLPIFLLGYESESTVWKILAFASAARTAKKNFDEKYFLVSTHWIETLALIVRIIHFISHYHATRSSSKYICNKKCIVN